MIDFNKRSKHGRKTAAGTRIENSGKIIGKKHYQFQKMVLLISLHDFIGELNHWYVMILSRDYEVGELFQLLHTRVRPSGYRESSYVKKKDFGRKRNA